MNGSFRLRELEAAAREEVSRATRDGDRQKAAIAEAKRAAYANAIRIVEGSE